MKTQLSSLRKLVLHTLPPDLKQVKSVIEDHTAQAKMNWLAEIPKIKEEILIKIHGLLLSNKNDRLVKRHLQQTQRECISLLNFLHENEHKLHWHNGLYPATAACLEEVLLHLFNSHQYYFDWEINAPLLQVIAAQKEVEQQMSLLKAGLKSKKIERELQELICNAFKRFTTVAHCTYQQINYMKMLQHSLIKLCNKIENVKFDELLVEHLYYYCFNENAFVCYCKNKITIAVAQLYQVEEQYEKLCQFEKCLMAQQEKTDCCFSTHRLSVKSQIFAFVTAELNYYQKKQHYHQEKTGANKASYDNPYRIKVSLSADSLAYMLRLMIESEMILNTPRSNLLDFMAKHVQTSGIGEKLLSPQSLGTKYKQVNQHTAMGIRQLLSKMLKQLDADFGKA